MTTVAIFDKDEEAMPFKERLESKGIHAEVLHEPKTESYWMTHEHGDVQLKVDEGRLAEAKHLIDEWRDSGELNASPVKCPECGSTRVQYPQYTRKFILPVVAQFIFSGFKNEYYCKDCHAMWSADDIRKA